MLKVVGASWLQTRVSWWLLFSLTLLGVVALYFGPSYSLEPDGKYAATVYYGKESKFRLEYWGQNNDPADIRPGVARGFYQPDIFKTGWATLEIETQESYSDHLQACAAGLLEGALSWQMILHHWQNTIQKTCVTRQDFCARTREFLLRNAEQVRHKAEAADASDPFWHQVNLFYIQLEGLAQGWRSGIKRSRRDFVEIPWIDFLWMNVMPDLRDLERKFNGTADFNPHRPPLSFVLLKYFPDRPSDFILAHGSTATYNSMLRIQKRYSFAYHDTADEDSDPVNGRTLTFSSYPGTIFSGDDFYQVRSNSGDHLTVVGTELKNNNQTTWSHEEEDTAVLMGPRVMAANRLSRDAEDWSALFIRRNSGTGNKQWLILDSSDNFTAWALEQMPGLTHAQEVTQRIIEDRHWIGCGIPYFQDILMQSEGFGEGSSLYHLKNLNPMYIALKKYEQSITSVSSVVDVMRSYDISVIGRSDLNGNSNLYGFLNVTASISKHHAHYHRHSGSRNDSDVKARHSEVTDGGNTSGKVEHVSNDLSATTQEPRGLLMAHNARKQVDAGLERTRTAAKQDFHSAHFYEHRDAGPVLNLKSHLMVEVTNDIPEYAKSEGSEDNDGEVVTASPLRHKYAGVYRNIENGIKKIREVDDSLNHVFEDADDVSSNKVTAESNETTATSDEDGVISSEQTSSENQTSVTHRSLNSINSSSYSPSSESGSLSSVDFSSSSNSAASLPSVYSSSKNTDDTPATKRLPHQVVLSIGDSNSIETKVSLDSIPDSSSSTDSFQEPTQYSSAKRPLEATSQDSTTNKRPLEATFQDSTTNKRPLEATFQDSTTNKRPLEATFQDSTTNKRPLDATTVSVEHAPKIDMQFRSSKQLLPSKPVAVNTGARFLNSGKQFRGIIDVKIAQGNADFIAISGPPYYRPKMSATGNLTASSTVATDELKPSTQASVEPFQWSTSNIRHQKHVGQPDLWNFDVFKATWVWS